MIVFPVEFCKLGFEVRTDAGEYLSQVLQYLAGEHSATVFRYEDQMHVHLKNTVSASFYVIVSSIDQSILEL